MLKTRKSYQRIMNRKDMDKWNHLIVFLATSN